MNPLERAKQISFVVEDLKQMEQFRNLSTKDLVNLAVNIHIIYFLDQIETRLINIADEIQSI